MRKSMRELDAKDQSGITSPSAIAESAVKQAKNAQTKRRTPCSSQPPVVPQAYVPNDPSLIPDAPGPAAPKDHVEEIRAATEALIVDLASGRATLDDIATWQATVLAHDPTPLRLVRELAEGRFRVRATLEAARALLEWLPAAPGKASRAL